MGKAAGVDVAGELDALACDRHVDVSNGGFHLVGGYHTLGICHAATHDGGRNPEAVKTAVVIHGVDRAARDVHAGRALDVGGDVALGGYVFTLARLGGAAAEHCGFIGAARDGERGVAENVVRETAREVVGLAAGDDVGLEGAGLEDEIRAADRGGNEAVFVSVLDGLAQIRAADDFVLDRDLCGVNEDVGCALDFGGRVFLARSCGVAHLVFSNVAAADDALAERDCAFTRHGDGGVAFNCGLAAVGEVVAANENVIVPEGDGLVLGCIDRNGSGLGRGGSSLSRDAAAGHDMAVVRAAIDLQGGVAGRELEQHVGRFHVSIVFGEAAAVDGTAEGAAVDGDGGVADGGVRLGDHAGVGT